MGRDVRRQFRSGKGDRDGGGGSMFVVDTDA